MQEKMREAESTKTYVRFFNRGSVRLMETTPPDILYELGIRAFTGSRDVPKDDGKALGLMQAAVQQAALSKNEREIDMAEYYLALIEKNVILRERTQTGEMSEEGRLKLMQNDRFLEEKAKKGVGPALYTYGKTLYEHILQQRHTDT